MKKLKSNNQNAPLQFVSPYTQVECIDRLEQHFGDIGDKLEYIPVDDTMIKFAIQYQYGSRQYVALGTLRVWATGEQTRVICQVQSPESTYSPIALAISTLVSFSDILFEPFRTRNNNGFHRTSWRVKAENHFYDRMVALLGELGQIPLTVNNRADKNQANHSDVPRQNHMEKFDGINLDTPMQLITPLTLAQCVDSLEQHFGKNGGVSFTQVDDTHTKFRISDHEGSTRIIAYGSLKAWATGEKTLVNCKVEYKTNVIRIEDPLILSLFIFVLPGVSVDSTEEKARKDLHRFYIRLISLFSNPKLLKDSDRPGENEIT